MVPFYTDISKTLLNEKSAFWRYSPLTFAVLIFIATVFIATSYHTVSKNLNEQHFLEIVKQTEKSILERYFLYEQSLRGGLGLFNASNFVDRKEWASYASTLNIDTTLPGINGIGFIEYVREENLDSFLQKARDDNAPSFENHPDTDFQDKFIIKYIFPENKNKKAIGLDIGFESNRRKAAEDSRDQGMSKLTKRIELVQDNKKRAGFLLLIPFYNNHIVPKSLSERRDDLIGWIYAPFIAENFLHQLGYNDSNQISYTVFDGKSTKQENIIFHQPSDKEINNFSYQSILSIAGQDWTIKWQENSSFIPSSNSNIANFIAFTGCVISIIAFLFLRFLINQNIRIAKKVDRQTSQLRQSKEFLTLIMNSIPDLVFVKDKNFKVVRANQAFLNIYPPNERDKIIGYTTVENFSKQEADFFLKQDRVAFENGISQVNEEIEIYTGEKLNLFTTKVRFYDENGEEFILGIARDISELIQTQKDLEEKVETRTKEYKEQKNIAEKAGKAKEDFLANMSHELRTPLNSIIGLTKILIDEGNISDNQEETLTIIDSASNTLLRTVNDILDISKIEAGKVVLENKPINLSGLLYSLIEQVKPLASQKGLVVKENLSELNNIYVSADEHRISRIITNLMSNAVKYTNEGHVKIDFQYNDQNENIIDFIVTVEDTGIGVAPDQIETIFDKFSQADKSTERMYGGTGLGLAITKNLIELMGGEIFVESQVNEGSTFKVILPLLKSSKEECEEDLITHELIEGGKLAQVDFSKARILVAEDHVFNQVFIKKILKRLGNDIFQIVNNGEEAVLSFKKNDYDLVLMDYHMPSMNGYDATRNIREHERKIEKPFNTPIIAMTADVMPGTEEKCLKVGMNDYIAKPIDENVLRKKIAKWLKFSKESDSNNFYLDKESESNLNLSLLEQYTDGDKKAQKELIDLFYHKSIDDIKILKDNCVDGESVEWEAAAHGLKGSSGYIGAAILQNLCSLAQSLKLSSKEEKLDIYKKIKKAHQNVCESLEKENLLEIEK